MANRDAPSTLAGASRYWDQHRQDVAERRALEDQDRVRDPLRAGMAREGRRAAAAIGVEGLRRGADSMARGLTMMAECSSLEEAQAIAVLALRKAGR